MARDSKNRPSFFVYPTEENFQYIKKHSKGQISLYFNTIIDDARTRPPITLPKIKSKMEIRREEKLRKLEEKIKALKRPYHFKNKGTDDSNV
jgi:hypothetical protein